MTASTIIIDYLGQGLHSARPVSPAMPTGGIAIFSETDTGDTYIWRAGAWVLIAGSSIGGISQLTADVMAGPGGGSQVATIADHAVTNGKMAQAAARTLKGNNGSSTADVADLTVAQVLTMLGVGFRTSSAISNYTIPATDNGLRFNNLGAAGDIVLTLPTAANGLTFGFAVYSAHYIRVQTAGSDVIWLGERTSATGGYIRSNTLLSTLQLEAHGAGGWAATGVEGAWQLDGGIAARPAFAAGSTTNGHVAAFDAAGNLVDGGAGGGGGGGSSIVVADSPPMSPSVGDGWWDGVGGQLYIWIVDASGTGLWVAATNLPGSSGGGGAGPYLPLSGGTLSGDLNLGGHNLSGANKGTFSDEVDAQWFVASGNMRISRSGNDAQITFQTLGTCDWRVGTTVQDGPTHFTILDHTSGSDVYRLNIDSSGLVTAPQGFRAGTTGGPMLSMFDGGLGHIYTSLNGPTAAINPPDAYPAIQIGDSTDPSIYYVSDSHTFIGSGASGPVLASLDSSGNFTVGGNFTLNKGDSFVYNAPAGTNAVIYYAAGGRTWSAGANSSGNYAVYDATGGVNRLTINASGLVQVGGAISVKGWPTPQFTMFNDDWTSIYAPDAVGDGLRSIMIGSQTGAGNQIVYRMGYHRFYSADATAAQVTIENLGIYPGVTNGRQCGIGSNAWSACWSYAYNNPSSRDLKTDIAEMEEGALARVNNLRAVNFRWREGETKKVHTGFIADEAAAVFGDGWGGYTSGESEDGERFEGLNSHELLAVLWKAVQELSTRVMELENARLP